MPVPEELVASVVADVSARMREPTYAQTAIASFIASHPDASRFVTLKMGRVGGSEETMHALFHAEIVAECLRRHRGTDALSPLGFPELDAVATEAPEQELLKKEPALASYVGSNLEGPTRGIVAHVALGLASS